jgi:hypothetical protein
MSTCQPFSIMRLTHEAIRSGLNQLEDLNERLSPATIAEYKSVFARLKEPQRKVYLGMLKGCSPEGKFADFAARVRPMLSAGELEAYEQEALLA